MNIVAPGTHLVGLISDTHGLLRPEVHQALAGVELILHAGDVGDDDLLDELALIAPVQAVYGNTDAPGRARLAAERVVNVGGLTIHVSHGHELGRPTPEALLGRYPGDVIVYGHTHRQLVARAADGRLVVNPGAAGPRRFDLLASVALLTVRGGRAEVEIVPIG